MTDIALLDEKLSRTLGGRRYTHSVYVSHMAVDMAKTFGVDINKAFVAGLIHDCAKSMSYDEMIAYADRYGYTFDDITLNCAGIMHADAGALYAKYEYGIDDTEILNAIRYHTVARVGMTALDKIIYVADMAEPMRDFDGVDGLRKLAMTDLEKAYIEALCLSLEFNIKKRNIIHPNTLYAYNEVLMNTREER